METETRCIDNFKIFRSHKNARGKLHVNFIAEILRFRVVNYIGSNNNTEEIAWNAISSSHFSIFSTIFFGARLSIFSLKPGIWTASRASAKFSAAP